MNILVFEGMLNMPLVRDQLILPMINKYPGKISYQSIPWSSSTTFIADIVIGHSLGGESAINYCKNVAGVRALITLDPRWQTNLSWLDILFPWQKAFTAPITNNFNFIHTPNTIFPGYPVDGATNTQVLSTHFTIPSNAQVFQCLEILIKCEGYTWRMR